ncbi:Syntaxin-binding protein 6 [Pteropus alecto]|uniref:Syntaxin-binding protein 6 n=1 Tax=Pteropus alecto TaxID=9402 RepID=L5L1Y0_PTEAL|nr:Syntaxin-binding protein 6 [Pteropus alecto]
MQFSVPATQHDMYTQDEQIPRRKTSDFSLIRYLCNCWSGMITVSGPPESVCPRSKCKLTSCWCSVRQAMDPGVELHLLRGKRDDCEQDRSDTGGLLGGIQIIHARDDADLNQCRKCENEEELVGGKTICGGRPGKRDKKFDSIKGPKKGQCALRSALVAAVQLLNEGMGDGPRHPGRLCTADHGQAPDSPRRVYSARRGFKTSAVTNKKPTQVSITKVKQFEGSTSFVRRSQWMLEQLRQVNGIDPNRDSAEFDLSFENASDQWVASTASEKCTFFQILHHTCQRYLTDRKPEFINCQSKIMGGNSILHSAADSVTSAVQKASQALNERGERLGRAEEKTEDLKNSAQQFAETAHKWDEGTPPCSTLPHLDTDTNKNTVRSNKRGTPWKIWGEIAWLLDATVIHPSKQNLGAASHRGRGEGAAQ